MSNTLKLSVSKTATFKNCKAKYKFSYILKLPKKEFTYHIFGRFVHRILELFHLSYINGSKESYHSVMSNAFNEAMQEIKGKISLSQKEEAYVILTKYLERLNSNKGEVARVKSVEQTFNLQINDGLILTGMIDRVQLDEDGVYHIIDYKTSKSKTYLKEDLLQLLTYAYVIYNEHPEITKVRVSYIMLKFDCEFITKEFKLDEILSIKDVYEKYAEEIHSETEYTANPQMLCRFCDYIDICNSGKNFVARQYKTGEIKW